MRNRRRRWFPSWMATVLFIVAYARLQQWPSVVLQESQVDITRPNRGNAQLPPKRWAYVFLMAECDPQKPSYRGILYNILAATYVLQFDDTSTTATSHSEVEVVVMVQMAASSDDNQLPQPEQEILERMGIVVRYLPKPLNTPSFNELVMAKFHVLELTEYSKVLFLDGDVLPLCRLDYLMQLSEQGMLRETVLHAMYDDPVNAGLFVVTPRKDSFRRIQEEMQTFDPTKGWNGQSSPSIEYRLWNTKKGSGWKFYCAESDQGLLLYWSRFLQRDVSIVVGPTIEHHVGSTVRREASSVLWDHSCLPLSSSRVGTFAQNANSDASTMPFYQDFFHMVGYSKAWESPLRRPLPPHKAEVTSSSEYWYFVLQQVIEEFDHDGIVPHVDKIFDSLVKEDRTIRGDLFTVRAPA